MGHDFISSKRTAGKITNANISVGVNLNASAAIPVPAFNPANAATYTNATSTTVYDSLGTSHLSTMYYRKTAANTWDTYLYVDGVQVASTPVTGGAAFYTGGVGIITVGDSEVRREGMIDEVSVIASALSRKPWPALCTTARLGVDSPPMNNEMPTTPSLPTTAISAEAPFSITYSSETIEVVGKYTWASAPPASYTTWPSGMSTNCNCGNQRCHSASGKAASKWLLLGSRVVGISQLLAGLHKQVPRRSAWKKTAEV